MPEKKIEKLKMKWTQQYPGRTIGHLICFFSHFDLHLKIKPLYAPFIDNPWIISICLDYFKWDHKQYGRKGKREMFMSLLYSRSSNCRSLLPRSAIVMSLVFLQEGGWSISPPGVSSLVFFLPHVAITRKRGFPLSVQL